MIRRCFSSCSPAGKLLSVQKQKRRRPMPWRWRALASWLKRNDRARMSRSNARLRQRYLTIVLAVFLLVVLAVVALLWRQNRISNSRAVAAAALTQLPVDPELSVLLGIESARYWHTREAQDALRLALAESYVSHTFQGHTDRIVKVLFDRQGDVVTGSWDGSVRIWDADTGKVKSHSRGDMLLGSGHMAISPDGMSSGHSRTR